MFPVQISASLLCSCWTFNISASKTLSQPQSAKVWSLCLILGYVSLFSSKHLIKEWLWKCLSDPSLVFSSWSETLHGNKWKNIFPRRAFTKRIEAAAEATNRNVFKEHDPSPTDLCLKFFPNILARQKITFYFWAKKHTFLKDIFEKNLLFEPKRHFLKYDRLVHLSSVICPQTSWNVCILWCIASPTTTGAEPTERGEQSDILGGILFLCGGNFYQNLTSAQNGKKLPEMVKNIKVKTT